MGLAVVWQWGWNVCPAALNELPPPKSQSANSPASGAALDVIEVTLPASDEAADGVVCLIGSLGDAGTNYPVDIELLAGSPETPGLPVQSRKPAELNQVISRRMPTENQPGPQRVPVVQTAFDRQRVFFLQTGRHPHLESSYQPVTTRLAAESAQVLLWQDVASPCESLPADLSWLIDCLEATVLPRLTELYGTIDDLDGDGKLSVCLTPRLADLPSSESAVEGLVQANDFQPNLPRPFSNQADVVFLSTSLRPGGHLQTILAHEAAHLAVFSRRRAVDPDGRQWEDDWLNEGLAHFAERECQGDWSNLEHRCMAFAANSSASPLIVSDAGRQGLWRHPGSRGASWLFLAWLADEFGPDVIRDLAMHPGVGCQKLERLVQQPFEELFRRWSVAVWQSQPSTESILSRRESRTDGSIQRISYDSSSANSTRLQAGLQRAGRLAAIEFTAGATRQTVLLRGTSLQACRCQTTSRSARRLRISSATECRLQVTVVAASESGDQVIVVR